MKQNKESFSRENELIRAREALEIYKKSRIGKKLRTAKFCSLIGTISKWERYGTKELSDWRKRRAKAGKETSKTKVRDKFGRWVKKSGKDK